MLHLSHIIRLQIFLINLQPIQLLRTGTKSIAVTITDYRSNGTLPVNTVITPVPPRQPGLDLRMLASFGSSTNKKPTKQPPVQKSKSFTFICTPNNGENNPPQVVRPLTNDMLLLEKMGMVQTINFEDSSHEYVVNKIRAAFAHLQLHIFKFYKIQGSAKDLHSLAGHYDFDTFGLRQLEGYILLMINS